MILIRNYLNANKNIFPSSLTSLDYIDTTILANMETLIKIRYGYMNMFTDNETEIQTIVTALFAVKGAEYQDIYNADILDPTVEFYEKRTNTGTVTNTDSGTVTNDSTPAVIATTTENKNTADNATLRAVGSIVNSSTGTDTVERTDDLTFERTDDLTEEREGFNNLITNVERLLNLVKNSVYDVIIKDVINEITYNIYGYEDLTL